MKKVLIPLAAIFVIGLGTIIFFLFMNFTRVQYQKDTEAHFMAAEEGDVTATYAGQTTLVAPENLNRVFWVLTISARKHVLIKPDCNLDDALVLNFPDDAQYTLALDSSDGNVMYICYTDDGKDQWLRIEGYAAMDWAVRAVSPEGIYGPNEVIGP